MSVSLGEVAGCTALTALPSQPQGDRDGTSHDGTGQGGAVLGHPTESPSFLTVPWVQEAL